MDKDALIKSLDIPLIDPFSCDTIRRGRKDQDGASVEELLLKEVGSPNPSIDVHGNIPCAIMQPMDVSSGAPAATSPGPGIIVLHESGTNVLSRLSWIPKVARAGAAVMGMDVGKEPVGTVLSRILRGVNYFDLRRDAIDHKAIVLVGIGEYGLWALCAAALDPRPAAVVAVSLPPGAMLEGKGVVGPADLAGMLPPRRVALLGDSVPQDDSEAFQDAYGSAGKPEFLRLEKDSGEERIIAAIEWTTGKEIRI